MFTKRIIPCLDVNDGRVVKGVNFVNLRDAGDPVEIAAAYDKAGADELVFLDITASSDNRRTVVDMVRRVAETVFIPFTVGGGIRTVEDFRMLLREGADKISAVLSLPDEVGSLHEVLTIFAVHGLNLVKLESRPLPGRSWEYLFFLEFDGSLADPAMDGALQELSQASAEMRVLGNFKSNL